MLELAKVAIEGLRTRPPRRVVRTLGCPEAELPDEEVIGAALGRLFALDRLRSQSGVVPRSRHGPTGNLRIKHRHLLAAVASDASLAGRAV